VHLSLQWSCEKLLKWPILLQQPISVTQRLCAICAIAAQCNYALLISQQDVTLAWVAYPVAAIRWQN